MDKLEKFCDFHPFSLKNHKNDFERFLKYKFSEDLDTLLKQAISEDHQETFSSLLNKASLITEKNWSLAEDQKLKLGYAEVYVKTILSDICKNKAINCARALLESGKEDFVVNLNVKIPLPKVLVIYEYTREAKPLYWAAANLSRELTTLFLKHGARFDESQLIVGIKAIRNKMKWRKGQSIDKLLDELCSKTVIDDVDTIKLLTDDKEVVEKAFQIYLCGPFSIEDVAILFMVSGRKLGSRACCQYMALFRHKRQLSEQNDDYTLLELFLTGGNSLDGAKDYLQSKYPNASQDELVTYLKTQSRDEIETILENAESVSNSKKIGLNESSDHHVAKELKANPSQKLNVQLEKKELNENALDKQSIQLETKVPKESASENPNIQLEAKAPEYISTVPNYRMIFSTELETKELNENAMHKPNIKLETKVPKENASEKPNIQLETKVNIRLETKVPKENASEKPNSQLETKVHYKYTSTVPTCPGMFTRKEFHHHSTMFADIQLFCGCCIQKSKFSTQSFASGPALNSFKNRLGRVDNRIVPDISCGNAEKLPTSLGRVEREFAPRHLSLCKGLASLALGLRKNLHA